MDLLERQTQLDELACGLQVAAAGRGKVVFVAGEVGGGKSALVEAFTNISRRGVRAVWGACDALQTPRVLGPVHEIAASLGLVSRETERAEQSRSTLFVQLVNELARSDVTTIAVLEDLHWADEATLDFLRYLGRRIQRTRCLLIATYRDDGLSAQHPLRRALGEVIGGHVVRIRVPALSLAAVKQLAREAHRDPERIHALTGGNAFFVRELLAAPADALPESVRDAVVARLMACSSAVRDLAEVVSLSPGRTERWLLEALLGEVGEIVEEAVAHGVLRSSDDSVSFPHELARLAVADVTLAACAEYWHKRMLAVLIERGADLSRIVHHAQRARDVDAVIEFATRAASQAATLGAHAQAAAHYAAVVAHADALPPRERAGMYEAYACECNLTSRSQLAIDLAKRALVLYRGLSDEVAQARVLLVLSRLYWQTGDKFQADHSISVATQLLVVAAPDSCELARAYSARAMLAMLGKRVDEALDFGRLALDLGRQCGDLESQVHSLNSMGTARLGSGDLDGLEQLEQALALALEHGLHEAAGRAYSNLTSTSVLRLELARAERFLRAGLDFCEEHEIHTYVYYLRACEARIAFLRGRWSEAAHLAAQLLEVTDITTIQRIPALITIALVRVRRGDPGAEQFLDEALELARRTGELQHIGRVATARAEAAWYRHDLESVAREATSGLEVAECRHDPWIRGELLFWLAFATPDVPRPTDIAPQYHLMMSGDWRGAAQAWAEASLPYERALALASGPEDALREALDILEELGAGPLAAIVRQRLRDLGVRSIPRGPRASTRRNPAGLTKREIQVLRLLVHGHTNSELAQQLHLATKTIDHHVSSILEKLDVHSRTEAVAAALTLGIAGSTS